MTGQRTSRVRRTVVLFVTAVTVAGAVGPGVAVAAGSTGSGANVATTATQAAPPDFTVNVTGTNSPVQEGNTLVVTTNVTNTGGTEGTQTVELSVGGSVRDATQLNLDPDQSMDVDLNWTPGDGARGSYTATVASENETATEPVQVTGPQFIVQWGSTNAPVRQNETLNVSTTIANIGDAKGTQLVGLRINGDLEDTRELNLSAGNAKDVTLRWDVGSADAGEYNASVSTEDHTESRNVTVLGGRNLSVAINSTNSPVFAGEALVVNASVANWAGETKTKAITLSVGGEVRDTQTVTVESGENRSLTLSWATGSGDAGNYTATVAAPNASASRNVTVRTVPGDELLVHGGSYWRGQVVYSGAFEAGADVQLTFDDGTVADTLSVGGDGVLRLETAGRATAEYELSGPNTSVRFTLYEQTLSVSANRTAVKRTGTNTSVDLTVTSNRSGYAAVVRSPGLTAAQLDGVFGQVDGERRDLDGDGTAEAYVVRTGSTQVSTVAGFEGVPAGTYTLEFGVTDTPVSDTLNVTVSVNEPPRAVVQARTVTVGSEVTIRPSITNDSAIRGYEWTVDGETVSSSRSLTYTFEETGSHDVTLTVTDDAGSTATAATTVTVEPATTPTDTPTPTPTSGSGPGFGVVAALVAGLAALLVGRRSG